MTTRSWTHHRDLGIGLSATVAAAAAAALLALSMGAEYRDVPDGPSAAPAAPEYVPDWRGNSGRVRPLD